VKRFGLSCQPPQAPAGPELEVGQSVEFTKECSGNHCVATGILVESFGGILYE
jgi:hypothetical protein